VSEKFSASKVSPILGLPVDDEPMFFTEQSGEALEADGAVQLSVIVPARNEATRLPACLSSLLEQDDSLFPLGSDWELLLVDDASTDATWQLMEEATRGRLGVRLLRAPVLDAQAFTGKSNACWFAAGHATGKWLVFTDADTLHERMDLLHALYEAKKYDVKLLSYSPRQIVTGLAQRTLMPLVFSELASVYKMSDVNDPEKRIAAANGQFLMVEREAYFAAGGHRAVGRSVLEDVDLARNIKRAATRNGGRGIRFRYAPDALSTRMYEGFGDMVEGWTKNLALLFPHALQLAAWRTLDALLFLLPLTLWVFPYLVLWQKAAIVLVWVRTGIRFYRRVARSNFPLMDCAISPLGLPLFIALLLRSWMQHRMLHVVMWKGREIRTGK
jgi:glycosyltransferase involved in cell wall biosynthesis